MGSVERATYFYSVLRLVPRVERGECFNVGVAMFSRAKRFLVVRTDLDEVKLAALAPGVEAGVIRAQLGALEAVASGDAVAGPMAALDISERFHWITSPSSTIIQASPIHVGLTTDPETTLDRLFDNLVAPVRS